jgi:hypothetical protein
LSQIAAVDTSGVAGIRMLRVERVFNRRAKSPDAVNRGSTSPLAPVGVPYLARERGWIIDPSHRRALQPPLR